MTPDTILETIHGSRLYGLARADSDEDTFKVVSGSSRTRVRQEGIHDDIVMDLDEFLRRVFHGSHQACEALWSPYATVDPKYQPMFAGLRVTGADAFARYRRTIKSFSYGTLKQRRHAVRLGYNLADLRKYGRFNPVLTPGQKHHTLIIADLYQGQSLFDIASNL